MVTTIACFRPHRHQKATDKRPTNRLQPTSLFHRVASCAHASKKFQRFTVLEWVPTKESATCMTRRLRPRHALASGRLLRLSPFRFHTLAWSNSPSTAHVPLNSRLLSLNHPSTPSFPIMTTKYTQRKLTLDVDIRRWSACR